MAERVRFELTVPVKVQRFSRPSRSTTLAPLRGRRGIAFETPKASSPVVFPKSAVEPIKWVWKASRPGMGHGSRLWPSGLLSLSGGRHPRGRPWLRPAPLSRRGYPGGCSGAPRFRGSNFLERRRAWSSRAVMPGALYRALSNRPAGRLGYQALPAPAQVRRMRSGRRGCPRRG